MNRLIDELAEYDVRPRFRAMTARGSKRAGRALLVMLTRHSQENDEDPFRAQPAW
jgi:hypothetical protein